MVKRELYPPPRFDEVYYQGLKNMNEGEQMELVEKIEHYLILYRGGEYTQRETALKIYNAVAEEIKKELEEHYQTFDAGGNPIVCLDFKGADGKRKVTNFWQNYWRGVK